MKKRNSFTLIELLVVIAIIGILAAMSLTSLNVVRQKAKDARVKSSISQVRNLIMSYADVGGGNYTDLVCSNTACEAFDTGGNDDKNKIGQLAKDIKTQVGNNTDGLKINASNYYWQIYSGLPSGVSSASLKYIISESSGVTKDYSVNPEGLIGYWKLEEPSGTFAADSSGNGNHGTYAYLNSATGKHGNGIQFLGSTSTNPSVITTPLNIGPTSTISFWATLPIASGGNAMTWNAGTTLHDLYFSNGKVLFNTADGLGNPFCDIPASASDGNFHNYTTVIPSATSPASLYYNGVLCGTAPTPRDYSGNFTISANNTSWDWQGKIDEVKVYNRVLTPADIAVLAS